MSVSTASDRTVLCREPITDVITVFEIRVERAQDTHAPRRHSPDSLATYRLPLSSCAPAKHSERTLDGLLLSPAYPTLAASVLVTMHFVTALAFAASASTLVTARLEQQVRRHDSHLAARAPRPEPFRLFSAPGATVDQTGPRLFAAASPVQHEERIALRERAEVSIAELDALLTSVHPFAAVAEPAQLSKRSDTPKKGLKCHRRKKANPSSASTSSSIQSTELAASVQQPAAQPSQDKSGERKSYAQQQADAQKGHEEAKASSAPSSNSGNSVHDASASASFATQKESTQKESDNSQSTEANKVWDGAKVSTFRPRFLLTTVPDVHLDR